jgi:hypothetical protein
VTSRELDVRPVSDANTARECAAMMATTSPWTTYDFVGVLTDFVAPGHDEVLLRKTRGSRREFRKSKT